MAVNHDELAAKQALKRVRAEAEALERFISTIPLARVKAIIDGQIADRVLIDQLIAHAHGGPKPDLTHGAQAVLTNIHTGDNK